MTGTPFVRFDFSGRVVVITGGASGIGLEVARQFVEAGASVVIGGRSQARLEEAVESLGSDKVTTVSTDVTRFDDVESLVAEAVDRFGRLDIAVNNAAILVPGDVTDVSESDWHALQDTNVTGLFHLAKAAASQLQANGGTLIATSSVSGIGGDRGQVIYNASKGAVSNFVRALALDWGPKGVRVNAVAPSLVYTGAVTSITDSPELTKKVEGRVPLGRIGQVDEVAGVFLFLASEAARYITGVVLPVDGGTSASNGQAYLE